MCTCIRCSRLRLQRSHHINMRTYSMLMHMTVQAWRDTVVPIYTYTQIYIHAYMYIYAHMHTYIHTYSEAQR